MCFLWLCSQLKSHRYSQIYITVFTIQNHFLLCSHPFSPPTTATALLSSLNFLPSCRFCSTLATVNTRQENGITHFLESVNFRMGTLALITWDDLMNAATHTHTSAIMNTHTHTLSLSFTHTHSLTNLVLPSHTHTHTLSLSQTHTFSLSFTHTLSHTPWHVLSLSLSLSHTHKHNTVSLPFLHTHTLLYTLIHAHAWKYLSYFLNFGASLRLPQVPFTNDLLQLLRDLCMAFSMCTASCFWSISCQQTERRASGKSTHSHSWKTQL